MARDAKRRMIVLDLFWTRDKDPRVPLGHASLLAALARDPNVEVRSVVVAVNADDVVVEGVVEAIMAHADGLGANEVDLAAGAYVWGEVMLRAILSGLRRRGFRGRIILGGPQVSYAGATLEQHYPEADLVVRGYGEDALSFLVRSHDASECPGVHRAGEVDRCGQASVALEALPSPWLDGIIPLTGQRFVRWETQRGCPYSCSFCQHREAGARLRRRRLDGGRIGREIEMFCAATVDEIAVLDPIFNLGDHAVEVLEQFAERSFSGRLALQCRAECIDPGFLDVAASLNVKLEFGLQTIHADEGKAVQRMNRIDKVDETLAEVRRRGIDHEVSLIFGLPTQTLASFEATLSWCLEREIPTIKAFPLLLLRGTALERDRERWGFEDGGGAMPSVVASKSFDRSDWLAMARLSEALERSEGRHPGTLDELRSSAAQLEPNASRWQPG